MDLWERARVFAEEAARRSSQLSKEAANRSSALVSETAKKSAELLSETATKSREIAAEATKKAEVLRAEAARAAGQFKTMAADLPVVGSVTAAAAVAVSPQPPEVDPVELEAFGITEDLREFVKGITMSTFRDFPLQDEPEMLEVPTVSNVRQDLNEWQAQHATLVLSAVKEISKFRYELCPRYMKERKFWRIYFLLVNSYVTPYEKKYLEEQKLKLEQQKSESGKEVLEATQAPMAEKKDTKMQSKSSTSSNPEHDLDVFLLGDLGSDDEGPDDGGDVGLDDDFDKNDGTSGLDNDDEKNKSKASKAEVEDDL